MLVYPVGEIGCHDEVVLDDEAGLLGVQDEPLDDLGGHQPLLGVEVGGGFVDEVHVGGFAEAQRHCNALQLTAGQVLHLLVDNVVNPESCKKFIRNNR